MEINRELLENENENENEERDPNQEPKRENEKNENEKPKQRRKTDRTFNKRRVFSARLSPATLPSRHDTPSVPAIHFIARSTTFLGRFVQRNQSMKMEQNLSPRATSHKSFFHFESHFPKLKPKGNVGENKAGEGREGESSY